MYLWRGHLPISRAFIVGLAGASGTGKSTLARRVASALIGQTLSMETYSISADELPFEERAKLNYDEPEAIDLERLRYDIGHYATGHEVEAPVYDFGTHLHVRGRNSHIAAGRLLIVEGILALHFPELRSYFDLAVYLEAPDDVCFRRRQVRDITERHRTLELIRWQYGNTVLPAAQRYVFPSKRYADLAIDCKPDVETVAAQLKDAIARSVASHETLAHLSE